ncbi:hypothetical protein CEXT_508411 [Caerostris extrusa]|uniref:Uncharacterized protein n=1 Tax=Caerostris extrusa TaxID=172846 RepID=A0AAV4WK14_CAEEX|nr:hypothetical protein CEXT_508411 [Caerostris extrusa]
MSRKYLEQMIEEIEFTNYQRCLQASNSLCHNIPSMYPDFRNFCYSNRYDWPSRGCFCPSLLAASKFTEV